jgi:tetratricopeptide (TPR) repeat protein
LTSPPPTPEAAVGQKIWTVPYPRNEFFTGRDAVIAGLRGHLTKLRKAAVCQAQAITGLGGIGKTQTAVEYAYRYRDEYQAVLWLNAESALSLKTGSAELAGLLQFPHPENKLEAAFRAFRNWLKKEPGWLLILDNADDPALLTKFLPETHQGHILITSRARNFQNLGIIDPVELEELSVEDARAFLLHRRGREDADSPERNAAEQLAQELDGLPLALEQAAAYIVEREATFGSYLQSYRTRGVKLVEERLPALGRYAKSVATTWSSNFESVEAESPAAADVLRLSAFLAPDAIPFELLVIGASQLGDRVEQALTAARDDPLLIHDLLAPLARFSLIRIDGRTETYSIHRMVQEALKSATEEGARSLWTERAVCALSLAFPSANYIDPALCGKLLPHALVAAGWIEKNQIQSEQARSLLRNAGWYLAGQAQFVKAETLFRAAFNIAEESLRRDRLEWTAGANEDALKIAEERLERDRLDWATSLNELAAQLQSQNRFPEAEQLSRKALEVRHGATIPDDIGMITSLNNLGYILLLQGEGKLAEAESLFRQALGIFERLAEPKPDELARTRNNLAEVLQAEGNLSDAEPLYIKAIDEDPDNRDTDRGRFLNNLAGLYRASGEYAEAERRYLAAIEFCRTRQGQQHPAHAQSLNNLADLYRVMGRYSEAEPLYKQAIEIRRTALGEQHPSYATSLNNLAELYRAMSRDDEAEPLHKQAMEIRRLSESRRDS